MWLGVGTVASLFVPSAADAKTALSVVGRFFFGENDVKVLFLHVGALVKLGKRRPF